MHLRRNDAAPTIDERLLEEEARRHTTPLHAELPRQERRRALVPPEQATAPGGPGRHDGRVRRPEILSRRGPDGAREAPPGQALHGRADGVGAGVQLRAEERGVPPAEVRAGPGCVEKSGGVGVCLLWMDALRLAQRYSRAGVRAQHDLFAAIEELRTI